MATTLSSQKFSEYIFDHVIPPELMDKIKSKTPLTESEIARFLPMLQLLGMALIARSLGLLRKALTTKAEKTDIRAAKRVILNKLDGEEESLLRKRGAKSRVRREQIAAVKSMLREAAKNGIEMSLHSACIAVWQDIKGGYSSAKSLYVFCHNHREEFPYAS